MNKMMITMGAAALATVAAMAQELPKPTALPTPAVASTAQSASASSVQSVEEFEVGALCKSYNNRERFGFFNSNVARLREFLESAEVVDKGYDTSNLRFDAKSIVKPGHNYTALTWEGRFNAPISEEYQFIVTGARGCPFIVTINGKTIAGSGQGTLRVNLVKGIENKVYIANGSADPITIQYTLTKYTKAPVYTLMPSAIKHIVEEEVPNFELK